MSESELRALIKREFQRFNPDYGTVDEAVERIMDAACEYGSERSAGGYDAALNGD